MEHTPTPVGGNIHQFDAMVKNQQMRELISAQKLLHKHDKEWKTWITYG